MLAYALMMAWTSLTVLITGIIVTKIASFFALSTLPVGLTIVGALNARQHQTITLIKVLSREQNIVKQLCCLFVIPKSSYLLSP
jgi:hypothetical protein|tara:strand:+ start:375 stop:626 length:252 start_codon:yes stop_codon:yes gene_type:complete